MYICIYIYIVASLSLAQNTTTTTSTSSPFLSSSSTDLVPPRDLRLAIASPPADPSFVLSTPVPFTLGDTQECPFCKATVLRTEIEVHANACLDATHHSSTTKRRTSSSPSPSPSASPSPSPTALSNAAYAQA